MKEKLADILFSECMDSSPTYVNIIPDIAFESLLIKLEDFINKREENDKYMIAQSKALIENLLVQQIVIRNVNSGYEKVYDISKEIGIIVNWTHVNKVL